MTTTAGLLFSAGGTGGGVYPAVAVAEALHQIAPETPLHFIGSVGGMESSLVPPSLFTTYHAVYSGPLNGVGVRRAVISLAKLIVGTAQAWRLAGKLKPRLVFLTGGWATFPVALACWLRRVPIVIFLPDVEPALAILYISRLAHWVMATTVESAQYFPKGTTVLETGYPLRAAILTARREDAIAHFGLDPTCKTLLVFGGSRGARSLNTALMTNLSALISDGLQILHITGELDWPTIRTQADALSPIEKARYHPFSYLHDDMGLALIAADLVVSRAGASTLGEFPQAGLPSILVPLAFAWRYQRVNADWLASRGAALRLDDSALATDFLPTVRSLIGDPKRLAAMRNAAQALARTDAAEQIAQKLIGFAPKP